MALRFRRSLTIVPGLRLNLGKKGVSLSAGVRGATVTWGKNGVYGNVGLPGTGLSYRRKISGSGARATGRSRSGRAPGTLAYFDLDADGRLVGVTSQGETLGPGQTKKMLQSPSLAEEAAAFMAARAIELNEDVHTVLDVHCRAKCAGERREQAEEPFNEPRPAKRFRYKKSLAAAMLLLLGLASNEQQDTLKNLIFLSLLALPLIWLWLNMRRHKTALADWQRRKTAHEQAQTEQCDAWNALLHDGRRREELLEAVFRQTDWPRDTAVNFELRGPALYIDMDLPEVEDMPRHYWETTPSGASLRRRERSEAQIRQMYARHVHGLCLLAASTAFWAVPELEEVRISGYTQRPDKSTGHIRDDYILSVAIPRANWQSWTRDSLAALDPLAALARFEMRRNMSKTGVFKTIEPLPVP